MRIFLDLSSKKIKNLIRKFQSFLKCQFFIVNDYFSHLNRHFHRFFVKNDHLQSKMTFFWVILIFWNLKSWSKKCSWRQNFVIFLIKKKNFPLVMLNLVFISFESVSRCNRCHRHICHRSSQLDIPLASPTELIKI